MIDSHCHIAGPEFASDLGEVVARARNVGVTRALVILAADDESEIEQAAAVAAHWPEARFSIGIHPHGAGKFAGDPALLTELRATLRRRTRESPLMDEPAFTRDLEAAYRSMWRRWCGAASV